MGKLLNFIKKQIIDLIIPVAVAVIIVLILNKYVVYTIKIPSTSMYPTLKVGDRAFATRVYSEGSIKRGDIVVFYNDEHKERMIKRVIGIHGDTIKIDADGQVYVNGVKKNEPYVKNKDNNAGNYKVPKHCFFFLGDNREVSLDSRLWKNPYINYNKIEGKARVIFFPFNRLKVF